jgi:hypothetical protein
VKGPKETYAIVNNGAGKRDIWILGAIMLAAMVGLVWVLTNFA